MKVTHSPFFHSATSPLMVAPDVFRLRPVAWSDESIQGSHLLPKCFDLLPHLLKQLLVCRHDLFLCTQIYFFAALAATVCSLRLSMILVRPWVFTV